MRICLHCGEKLDEDYIICPSCGHSLGRKITPAKVAAIGIGGMPNSLRPSREKEGPADAPASVGG